jgi:thiol-disulfide isomerase/thioredoxin
MLSKLKTYTNELSKKVLKDKRYIIGFVIALIVIAWVIYGITYYIMSQTKETFIGNNEINTNGGGKDKVATIYLFSADWCPHCKKAEPEWVNFEKEYNNTKIKEYIIKCIKVNCSKPNPESDTLMEKYNVSGFPTVIMIKDGEPISFDAPVKTSTLTQFCYSML